MATDGQGNRDPTDVSTSVSSQLPNESDRAQQEEEWRSELFRVTKGKWHPTPSAFLCCT